MSSLSIPVWRAVSRAVSRSVLRGDAVFAPSDLDNLALWLSADSGVSTGGARQYTAADKAYHAIADNASLSTGDIDFTIGCWVYIDSTSVTGNTFFAKWDNVGQREYLLWYSTSAGKLEFRVTGDGTSGTETAAQVASPGTGAWFFLTAWHDAASNEIAIQVNNGTPVTAAHAHGAFDGERPLHLGVFSNLLANTYHSGRMSRAFVTKRVLTAAERTYLYNAGSGRTYGELGVAGTDGSDLLTSLVSYWNMNESTGSASLIDAHGANDLTFTNTELLTDGGLEAWASATNATSWTEVLAGTGAVTQEAANIHAGTYAVRINGGDSSARIEQYVITSGNSYNYSVAARHVSAGNGTLYFGNTATVALSLTSVYQVFTGTKTASGNTAFSLFADNTQDWYADSVSLKAAGCAAVNGPTSLTASDSIGTKHGVLTGFSATQELTAWSTDVPSALGSGYSLTFDGVDDYVNISSLAASLVGATTIRVSGHFKTSSTATQAIYGHNDSAGGNKLILILNAASSGGAGDGSVNVITTGAAYEITLAGTYNDGEWHEFDLVAVSGGLSTLTVDGNVATGTLTAFTPLSSDKISIGMEYDAGVTSDHFVGKIDDIAIEGNATPVARWSFDDGPQSSTVADGDPVLNWLDRSSNRRLAQQTTAAARPTYMANILNGKPVLRFDGTDDRLLAAFGVTLAQPNTIFLVSKLGPSADGLRAFLDGITADGRHLVYKETGVYKIFANTSLAGTLASDENFHVFAVKFNDASSALHVDGTLDASGAAGSSSTTGLSIGAAWDGSVPMIGDIAEIIVYSDALTDAERAKVEAYLASKYAL